MDNLPLELLLEFAALVGKSVELQRAAIARALALTRAAPRTQDPSELSVRARIENGVRL